MSKDKAQLIDGVNKSDKVHPASPQTNVPSKKTADDLAREALEEKQAKIAADKEEKLRQKQSFKYILRYQRRETVSFVFGMIALVLGSASDFVVPLYIGMVIDKLEVQDFDGVKTLCLQLLIIVLVSAAGNNIFSALEWPSVSALAPSTS